MESSDTITNLYFDGMLKECTVTKDRNGELVYETVDKYHFAKFPDSENLDLLLKLHNEANKKAP